MRTSDTTFLPSMKRTERFFEAENQWYFNSREGIRFGGYPTRFDAELGAHLLFVRVSQAETAGEAHAVMAQFVNTPLVALARSPAPTNNAAGNAAGNAAAPEQNRWQIPALRRWFDSGRTRSI